jgi:hypothetical protein
VVIGVPPSQANPEDIKAEDTLFSPIEQRNNPFVDAPDSDSIPLAKHSKHNRSPTDTTSTDDNITIRMSTAKSEETVKRSTVKVLRGILKKPRRFSKEVVQSCVEEKTEVPATRPSPDESTGDSSSVAGGIIPEISSRHSDDDSSTPGINGTIRSPTVLNETPRSPLSMQRGSLQLPEFDRMLFALRGAELREQYMRGSIMMEKGVL